MLLIPGIIASSKLGAVGDFESIATVTVGAGGSSSIQFNSIPATFQHLQIRGIVKVSGATVDPRMRFNGVSTTSYRSQELSGDGSLTESYDFGAATSFVYATGKRSTTQFSGFVCVILDYANTNKNTTTRSLVGVDNNGSGTIGFNSGLFVSTAAISSIEIFPSSGTFTEFSHFALYGIKG